MKFYLFLIVILVYIKGYSQNVSNDMAIKYATNYYYQVGSSVNKTDYKNIIIVDEFIEKNNDDTLLYIFNFANNKGFIIISADKRSQPIIGYSLDGAYSLTNQPPAFTEWMANKKNEIIYIKANDLSADHTITAKWPSLESINYSSQSASVGPLLTTTWNQGCYYNVLCPADASGPCAHAWAGCVATVQAQIMKYWNYPVHGIGSNSYKDPHYGTISANFGNTTYNWAGMPNSISSTNSAIDTLIFHCGVSVEMVYSTSGSLAYDSRSALVHYFNYSSDAQYIYKSDYTETNWESAMIAELNSLRPIWYRGDNGTSGHAFVCDGYQNSNYFHFNWGWSGAYNGYFLF